MVAITVKDDGIGIPEEVDIDKTNTLGLKLVNNLVQSQLKGKLQVRRDNGTEIIVQFRLSKQEEKHA
jgi:two-component sensor histidine kinase